MLQMTYTMWIVKYYHIMILFRIYSIKVGNFIEKYLNLSTLSVIISIVCSRLHLAWPMILVCLLLLRLDSMATNTLKYYKRNPSQQSHLQPYFSKRHMWKATKTIIEQGSSNPQVQAAAVAVGGAVIWKAVDYLEAVKQEAISEAVNASNEKVAEETNAANIKIAEEANATNRKIAEETNTLKTRELDIRERELEQRERFHQEEKNR